MMFRIGVPIIVCSIEFGNGSTMFAILSILITKMSDIESPAFNIA